MVIVFWTDQDRIQNIYRPPQLQPLQNIYRPPKQHTAISFIYFIHTLDLPAGYSVIADASCSWTTGVRPGIRTILRETGKEQLTI